MSLFHCFHGMSPFISRTRLLDFVSNVRVADRTRVASPRLAAGRATVDRLGEITQIMKKVDSVSEPACNTFIPEAHWRLFGRVCAFFRFNVGDWAA